MMTGDIKNGIVISVIIPVYNCEKFLKRCLDSIIAQTYPNLEIILIDDGSTDSSADICAEYVARDERFCLIQKENGGVSAARNEGLIAATGDYIGFVDADDFIHPEMYRVLLKALLRSHAEIACCDLKIFSEEKTVDFVDVADGLAPLSVIMTPNEAVIGSFGGKQYEGFLWNKLFLRNCLINRNGEKFTLSTDISISEDRLFFFQALANSNTVVYVQLPLYYYRKNMGSASNIRFSAKNFTALISYERILLLAKTEFSEEANQIIAAYFVVCNLRLLLKMVNDGQEMLWNKKKLLENIKQYYPFFKASRQRISYKVRVMVKAVTASDQLFLLIYRIYCKRKALKHKRNN